MFSFPGCASQQFIPSFIHPVGAESVSGTGEAMAPHGDSCFVDTATFPFSVSLLVLSRDRPRHTESPCLVLFWRNIPPKKTDLEKGSPEDLSHLHCSGGDIGQSTTSLRSPHQATGCPAATGKIRET